MQKVITMNKTRQNKEARKGVIHLIDAQLANGILRIMKAESLGNRKDDVDEFVEVRNMAFSTILPELQLVALRSNDRTIRSQAWLNMNLSPEATRAMRGKVSRQDPGLRTIAARALRHQLYLRRERRAEGFRHELVRHSHDYHQKAAAHARLAVQEPVGKGTVSGPVPAAILASASAKAALPGPALRTL